VPTYVGAGKGTYKATTSYTYVGQGVGEFDLVGAQGRRCSVWVCCCSSVAACLVLAVVVFFSSTETTTTSVGDVTSLPYDCDAGYSNWRRGWSLGKKAWCCDHEGRACPPRSSSAPYSCELFGNPGAVQSWSISQKSWCCAHRGAGCSTSSAPSSPNTEHDCGIGVPSAWSITKKVWCCSRQNVGCPTAAPILAPASSPLPKHMFQAPPDTTTDCRWNCEEGFHNWEKGWSDAKKAFCCKAMGRGCATTTTEGAYDCNEGYSNWAQGWSTGKKAFCCHTRGLACLSR